MGAGRALEGAGDAGGDPAAVEVAGLGEDALAIDGALVDAGGVEGEVVAQGGVGRGGMGVAPGGVGVEVGVQVEGPIGGEALELAEAAAAGGGEEVVESDVGGWDVEDGRVAGLEEAEGARGVGEKQAVVEDAEVAGGGFEARGTRVVPDGFEGRNVWHGQRADLGEALSAAMVSEMRVDCWESLCAEERGGARVR